MHSLNQNITETIVGRSSQVERRSSGQIAKIVVLAWLVFLGIALWQHAKNSQMPPTYDALNYFAKGKNIWLHLRGKHFVNPFNLPPTYRPPGTVLMSFPLGYHNDFHGFYFRSVFFPIVCFVAA